MDSFIEGIGLVSSILITIMFVPQIVHVYRTKDTHALNYAFLGINIIASILGLVYSIYYTVIPMIVANTSAGLFSISLITMKRLNGLKEQSPV
jgi:uncharacterized protein with PQ loop repeat